jgi:ABC-2 type transport system permease protein
MNVLNKIVASKYGWLLLLLALVGINYMASIVHARFDLTKEKRYTLSKATKALVNGLDDKVQIDVFLRGEFPAGFKKLANTTKEFLGLLKDRNGAKVSYQFISPTDETADGKLWGDSLVRMGAVPINLTVQKKAGESSNIIFPVAIMSYKGKQSLVNLYPGANGRISQEEINSAEALMEYQFAKTLDKLAADKKTGIAYATGNGEPINEKAYDISLTLGPEYDFRMLNLKEQPKVPDAVKLLLIVKPIEQFSEQELIKIDQFVMNGGKLLCFIDNLIAEQDSLAIKPETIAYDRNLGLTELFFKYGVRINPDLVMDLQCDVIPIVVGGSMEKPQMEFLHWNYYPVLTASGALNKSMGYIAGRFVNSIDTIAAKGIKKTPLLESSANSRKISTPALISLNENKDAPEDAKFKNNAIPVAMLLEGKFNSAFQNRLSKTQLDTLAAAGQTFIKTSSENKIIIVADGDIVLNDVMPETGPIPMGWNKFTYREYQQQTEDGKLFLPVANRDFLQNCVELLVNNPAISETRNKDIVLRLLDSKKVNAQQSTWQFINIALPILVIILFGWLYQQIRKRKYA